MIKSITMRGIKSIVGYESQQLSGLDVFTGPNGAGKSTRLEALMVAMQGYLSVAHGKTNAKTMELANGDEMIVGVETDNHRLERVYTKAGKTVRQTGRIDGADSTYSDTDTAIKAELGDFPMMFDLGLFTSLPPNQKKSFLFRISNMLSEFDDMEKFLAELSLAFFNTFDDTSAPEHLLKYKYEVESFNELPRDMWDEFFEKLECSLKGDEFDEYRVILDEFKERFTPDPNILFDEVLIPVIKEEAKFLRRLMSDTSATKRKLAEAQHEIDGQRTEARDVRQQIDDLETARDEKFTAIAKNEARSERFKEHMDRLVVCNEKVESDTKFLEELDIDGDMAKLAEREERFDSDMGKIASEEASRDIISKRINSLSGQKKELELDKDGYVRALHILTDNSGICVVASELNLPCHQDMTEAIKTLNDNISSSDTVIAKIDQELTALYAEFARLDTKIKAMNEVLKRELDAYKLFAREIDMNRVRRTEIGESLSATKRELDELRGRKLHEPIDVDILKAELDSLNITLEASRDNLIKIEKSETMVETLRDTIMKGQTASEKLAVVSAFEDAVVGIRNSFMEQVTKPLVSVINGLMRNIDPSFSVRFDAGDKFDILVSKGGEHVSFSTISGGEKLIFAVAMLTAIVLSANPAIKVLCLECAELDKDNMKLLLDALPKIAGELDNVLVAYPHNDIEVPVDWTWHKVK